MNFRRIQALNVGAVLSIFLASCSGGVAIDDPTADVLGSAIRAVGYSCTDVVDSSDLGSEDTGWRVECQGAVAYTAVRTSEGSICVVPMPYVDGVVPAGLTNHPQNEIDERCILPTDI